MLRANLCRAEIFQPLNFEEQSRGIMEFQEEKARDVEDTRGSSIAAGRMAEDFSSLGRQAKSNIAEAAESAKAEARRIASQQKEAGADRLGDVAGAVHGAARTLETGMPQVASYVHGAAAQLEDAAKTLRHRSVDELIDGIGSFARAQPAVFFAGAMLAGLALTRFLKSSGPIADDRLRQTDVRGQ
jgi:ABC-type transporter Mla subunit MlaD